MHFDQTTLELICAAYFIVNCFATALPIPSGKSELYTFVYRFLHLILQNIPAVAQSRLGKTELSFSQFQTGNSLSTIETAKIEPCLEPIKKPQ